jgi:hypothetical protein
VEGADLRPVPTRAHAAPAPSPPGVNEQPATVTARARFHSTQVLGRQQLARAPRDSQQGEVQPGGGRISQRAMPSRPGRSRVTSPALRTSPVTRPSAETSDGCSTAAWTAVRNRCASASTRPAWPGSRRAPRRKRARSVESISSAYAAHSATVSYSLSHSRFGAGGAPQPAQVAEVESWVATDAPRQRYALDHLPVHVPIVS